MNKNKPQLVDMTTKLIKELMQGEYYLNSPKN